MLQYGVAALLLLLVFVVYRCKGRIRSLPPGPTSLPLIGHLHLFSQKVPPYKTLSKLSQIYGGGYMWLKLGSHSTLVISSPKAAEDVLKSNDLTFASRPRTAYTQLMLYDGKDIVFAPYGQHWRHLRKVCTVELFTSKRIQYLRPVRTAEMKNCLTDLMEASRKGEVVNMSQAAYKLTFNINLMMVMGKSYSSDTSKHIDSDPAYIFWVLLMELKRIMSHFHISDCFPWLKWLDFSIPRMKQLGQRLDEFMQEQLDEHRSSFDKSQLRDFMDVLISISEDSQLDDTTIKAVALDILAAGLETSAVTLEWTMAELVRHPEAMKKLQKELLKVVPPSEELVSDEYVSRLPYLQAVVKENFRLHPPVPLLIPHQSTNECVLEAGYEIPEGTQTLVNAYAIGRDESIWRDPLQFKPERMMNVTDNVSSLELGNSFELLPFGVGRRICPGMNMGLTTVHFMLANLVHKFDWETVEPVDVEEATAFTLERANPLKLRPVTK